MDGQPCAPCPADTFSADGTVCVACPAGMHPDAFAARCTMDADDVYSPPVLHSWLAFTFDVADLAWFSNADVRDGIMMAIAASITAAFHATFPSLDQTDLAEFCTKHDP